MYSYNISKTTDETSFKNSCYLIESNLLDLHKEQLLKDVDGTEIQIYNVPKGKIKVYNDFEVGAVYIDSDIDLSFIFK